jgi:tRNA uridine 5-carboxymethylaminomethyl modification enzyme
MNHDTFDVVVIGGGLAGCEAALAAARMGCTTMLMSTSLDNLAVLACSPSVGGPGRAHLVREIDALGGSMGRMVERNSIFHKTTNPDKGPAVRSPWAIVDKRAYSDDAKSTLEAVASLRLYQGEVTKIERGEDGSWSTQTFFGDNIGSRSVIVCSGTFLAGRCFYGGTSEAGGRSSEMS